MSHHENAYFVDTQLITCHAIHPPYPCIPHHSYAHTPDTAHSPVAAPAEASVQQLPKHLRNTCRSICAATAEASVQQLPKHLRSNCRNICAATVKASVQQLSKHLCSNCRSICAATAEASTQPMLDGDSLPVRYGVHGQREGIVLYQHLEELLRGVFAIGAFEKME